MITNHRRQKYITSRRNQRCDMAERNLDFDKITDRRNTNCLKYDFAVKRGMPEDVLPLWVADMDFKTSSYIEDAVIERTKHGIFGYSEVQTPYFETVRSWMKKHHDWDVQEKWLIKTPGVVFALAMAVKAYTAPGDAVLIQSPVYYPFSEVIADNGRRVVSSTLVLGNDNRYHMDVADFEEKLKAENVKLFFLCNPHNPAGRVWTAAELTILAALADKYEILVIADEIHGEFVFGSTPYTPYASVTAHNPQKTVTLSAASKTFNLAGLQNAFIVAESAEQRRKIDRAINDNECCDVNPFGVAATIAAYNEGEAWLYALLAYLHDNARVTTDWFKKTCPAVTFSRLEGTYLMWADCRSLRITSQTIEDELLAHEKVWINAGSHYGAAGEGFIRLNIAMPRARLMEGLKRLTDGIRRLSRKTP